MTIAGFLLSRSLALGALTQASNADQVGTPFALVESPLDDVNGGEQKYAFALYAKQTGPGTVRVLVLTSHDGAKWTVAAAGKLLTQDGEEVFEVVEPSRLLTYVAVVTQLTGAQKPSHVFSAHLLSNGGVTLKAISATPSLGLAVVDASVDVEQKSGRAVVANGQSQADVVFSAPWADTDFTLVVTPEDEAVSAWVANRTATGFRIVTSAPVDGDTTVHWLAVHD